MWPPYSRSLRLNALDGALTLGRLKVGRLAVGGTCLVWDFWLGTSYL